MTSYRTALGLASAFWLALFAPLGPMVAQAEEPRRLPSAGEVRNLLQWYKDRLDVKLPELRHTLEEAMSPSDRERSRALRLVSVVDGNVNAQAKSRTNLIYVSAGLLEVVDWVSTVGAVGTKYGAQACYTEYVRKVAEAIQANSERARRGQVADHPLESAFLFMQPRPSLCHGISEASFKQDKVLNDLRDASIDGSLYFILGHEIGHHVLGHTSRPATTAAQSRVDESRADAFAFRTMAGAEITPAVGLNIMVVFASVEGFDFEESPEATHPSGAKRVLAMVDAADDVMEHDPKYVEQLRRLGKEREWRQAVERIRELARKEE